MIWLVVLATAVAFGLGFALSWIRMRRRIQARMNQQVEVEIRRQIQQRVMHELSGGRMRKHVPDTVSQQQVPQQKMSADNERRK